MTNEQALADLITMLVKDLYRCDVLSAPHVNKYMNILEQLGKKIARE